MRKFYGSQVEGAGFGVPLGCGNLKKTFGSGKVAN
jgi:hypothetical protein